MDTVICQKLKLDKYEKKAILHCPHDIDAFQGLDFDTQMFTPPYDMVLVFIFSLQEFRQTIDHIIRHNTLSEGGVVYFAYPKKGNKRYDTSIGRDDFFTIIDMNDQGYVADSDIKFNKMVAFNDTFTVIGLKHDRQRRRSNAPSQCVGDYVDRLPQLAEALQQSPEARSFFQSLTPGYQRGWARYVYGVKTEATQRKHLQEAISCLEGGFKSIDHARQGSIDRMKIDPNG